MPKEKPVPVDELAGSSQTLADRFIQRWDLYALQSRDGRYVCVHKPLTSEKICSHLRGEVTLGTYVLTAESKAKFIVFDFDTPESWPRLINLNTRLNREGIPSYLEQSRRGGHLWFFFAEPIAARKVRKFAQGIQDKYQVGECEIFPKQDHLLDGPGSLIRLPFGIHRLTGERYSFYKSGGEVLSDTIRKQITALENPWFVPRKDFNGLASFKTVGIGQELPLKPNEDPKDKLSERIKSRLTVYEFIGQYVELKPTANGAIGKCPFHEDQHPSLGVNDQDNYWHCFAGCGGGSIIDFWSKWREKQGLDGGFVPTITELAEMLFK
jgi:hypothetical protein